MMRADLFKSLTRRLDTARRQPVPGRPIATTGAAKAPFATVFGSSGRRTALLLLAAALAAWMAWPLLRARPASAPAPSAGQTPPVNQVLLPAIVPESPPVTAATPASATSADGAAAGAPGTPEPVAPTMPAVAAPGTAAASSAFPGRGPDATIRAKNRMQSAGWPRRDAVHAGPRHAAAPASPKVAVHAGDGTPLVDYTLNTVYPGQAWIQAEHRIVVVRIGDRIGDATVERIDPVARRVVTSAGIIR